MHRFIVALSLSSLFLPLPASAQCDCEAEDTLVVGHRGDGTGADENTIASVERAFAAGADMVEIDVQQSSDGVVVLMHDDTVDRTTEGTGCVSSLSAAELAALDVPTLAEFLVAVDGALDVEIKLHDTDACPAQDLDALANAVATDLAADPVAERRVLVTSFDRTLLQRLHTIAPSLPIGLLGGSPDLIDAAREDGFAAAALLVIGVNSRTVRRAREADIELYVWTVNGRGPLEDALALGVDGVITDTVIEGLESRTAVCDAWMCEPDAGPSMDAGMADAGPVGSSGGCAVRPSSSGAGLVWFGLAVSFWIRRRRY